MNISSSNSHAKAMQSAAMTQPMLPTQVGGSSSSGSMSIQGGVSAGSAVGSNQPNLSPSERLERYAEHMEQRLAQLEANAAESGLDLSAVRSAFQDHITRLQDAMANGLQGDDLARGIENTSNLVRDGVREAFGLVAMNGSDESQGAAGAASGDGTLATNIDIEHSNDRLDAIEKGIQQRLEDIFSASRNDEKEVVQNAREQFAGHMERLRNALASGNMSLEDMQRSMDNIMQHLEDNLAGATTYASETGGSGASSGAGNAEDAGGTQFTPGKPMEAEIASRQQALSLLGKEITATRGEQFGSELSSLIKPGSPVSNFLLEMREATQKAKGSLHEGYTPAAMKASILGADLPGSSLNFKV